MKHFVEHYVEHFLEHYVEHFVEHFVEHSRIDMENSEPSCKQEHSPSPPILSKIGTIQHSCGFELEWFFHICKHKLRPSIRTWSLWVKLPDNLQNNL